MSRIPFAQLGTGVVNIGAPPQFSLSDAEATSSGPLLQGIGKGLGLAVDMGQKLVDARDAVNVSNEITDASGALGDFRLELEKDPDVAGREARFQAKALEVKDAAAERLGSRQAVDSFTLRYNQLYRPMQLTVKQQARDEELQNHKVDLSDSLDRLATQSVFAKSDAERQALQAEAKKSITDSVRTGYLSATAAHGFQKAYLGRVDAALAGEMVRTNPGAAIAALGDTEKFPYLSADQRVALRSQAQQRSESLGVQARAELRADVADFVGDLKNSPATGQMPSATEYKALRARAGNSALGVQLDHVWGFYNQVSDASTGKSIPELQATIADIGHRATPATGEAVAAPPPRLVVTDPQLNGGKPTVIPAHAGAEAGDRQGAIASAVRQAASGTRFDSFATAEDAETARLMPAPPAVPATADEIKQGRVMQVALQKKIAARDADPAAYALKSYPTIAEQMASADTLAASQDAADQAKADAVRQQAWSALVAAQRREGVPEHRLALVTKPQLDAMNDKLTSADGQQRVDYVGGLRTQFGDALPALQAQFARAGKTLPPDVDVLLSLPEGANLPKVALTEAYKVTDKQAAEVLGGEKMKSVDGEVRGRAAQMALTMAQAPGGPEKLAGFQDAAEKLARLYAIRGETEAKAAERALNDVFYDHWATVDTVRVPKVGGAPVAEASAVRQAQQDVIAALPKMDLMLPPAAAKGVTESQRRDMLVNAAKSNGYWMTTGDDKGMVLMAGPGLPVRFADGRPLILPFDSANAAAANRGAAANLRRRQVPGVVGDQDTGISITPQDLGGDPDPDHVQLLPKPLQRAIVDFGTKPGEAAAIESGVQ